MPVDLKPVLPADAIAALKARGARLDPTFNWQDAYAEDHARAFTVAKSAGFDILGDIYAAIETGLKDGSTPNNFAKLVTPTLQEKGWWGRKIITNPLTGLPEEVQLGSPRRLKLIFDVNMRVSYAAGHWASFERNRAARPLLRYVHLEGQENPRLQHAAWHNIVLPIDHPWWKTHACPNGWGCHCTLQSLSQRDVDALQAAGVKLKFEAPTIETTPWENKVTGEIRHIPKGIDAGWDYNPGKAGYRANINAAFADKITAASPELLEAGIADRLRSSDFQRFFARPEGRMPVMVLPEELSLAIGTKTRAVALSDETMRKQLNRHPDLVIEDYQALPSLGSDPTLVVQDGPNTLVLVQAGTGHWRYAAIKAAVTDGGLFLTSYRFARDRAVADLLAKPGIRVLIDKRKR